MNAAARQLLKLARTLLAEVTVSQGDDYRHVIGDAIRRGDSVTFLYRKKDGSTRQVRIQPMMLLGDKGVRGTDLDDPAKTPKVFMFDGIGGGARTVAPKEEPSQPELIVLKGDETPQELESIFARAVKHKIKVRVEYASKDDGANWTRKVVEDVPAQYGNMRIRGEYWNGVRFAGGKIVPYSIMGDYNTVVRRWEKIEEEKRQKALRSDKAMNDLIAALPELSHYWRQTRGHEQAIEQAWDAMNTEEAAEVDVGKTVNTLEGPYAPMDKTKLQEVIYTLHIRRGQPWDKSRMKIEQTTGREYWTDDEGNESSGGGGYGGGGYRRRW